MMKSEKMKNGNTPKYGAPEWDEASCWRRLWDMTEEGGGGTWRWTNAQQTLLTGVVQIGVGNTPQ